jgi:hypothetical protein
MPELLWHNLKSRELKAMAEQDAIKSNEAAFRHRHHA